jgi:hypothetical protein
MAQKNITPDFLKKAGLNDGYCYCISLVEAHGSAWELSFVVAKEDRAHGGCIDETANELYPELKDLFSLYYGDDVKTNAEEWDIGAAEFMHYGVFPSEAAAQKRAAEVAFILEKAGFKLKHEWSYLDKPVVPQEIAPLSSGPKAPPPSPKM